MPYCFTIHKEEPMIIHGRNPVTEALSAGRVQRLFLRTTATFEVPRGIDVPVERLSPGEFRTRFGGEAQGVAAEIADIGVREFDGADDAMLAASRILVLDQVQDVQNFGAVLRAALCFGCSSVLVAKYHQAPLSAAAVKASSGAALSMDVAEAVNLGRAMDSLKEAGFTIYAADVRGGVPLPDAPPSQKAAIIIGSESKGVRPGVLERADVKVLIPMMLPDSTEVDSLNAAQSAAVMMYALFGSGSGVENG